MAGYAAVIDLRVNGLDGLRTVEDRVSSITRLIKQLKPVPTLFGGRAAEELRKAKNELADLVKAYADGNTRSAKFATSVAGLNQQLTTFRTVAANAKTGSDEYTNSIKAAEKATNKLVKAELERLDTLNQLYTRTATGGLTAESQGPSGLTKSVLALGKELPRNIAGLRAYGTELDRVFNLVEAGSVDYRTLQREIARVNRQMDIMQGLGPVQGPALPPSMRGNAGRTAPSSPIRGRVDIPGSPRALEAARRTAVGAQNARARLQENLMLGVGFPLLFGGGAGEVAGGLLGSFGPGMGFGGQILGSAIGGILDDFISSAGELGAALNPATADLDRLVDALGGASTVTGQYIKKLEALERSEEALAVATAELENLVGKQGVEALRQFGDDSTRLREVFGQAMTQMQAGVANLINSTGILQALTAGIESGVLLQQALQSQDPRQRELVQQRRQASGPAFFGADQTAYFKAEEQLIANQRIINAEKQKQYEASLKLLDTEEKQVEITKQTAKLAKELKSSYDEILKSAEDRIQKEQAAVDRGLALSKARYEAELALNQLEQTRLERAYKYAQSQQERLDIAIAMFNTEVESAKLEYQQQLESIAAEERKLEIQLEQYRLAQETILLKADEARLAAELEPDAELRAASFKRIDETTARYLDKTREIIVEVEKQLAVQREIGEVQRQTAKTQLENKILAAQTSLEQKLVSEEIGLSENQALRLSNALAAAKQEAIFTAERGQQIVGVIEVGTQKTYLMATAMSNVAAQAANAAAQIRGAVSAQNTLNAAKAGGGKSGGTVTRAAKGAYMSGGFQAFADGGIVNRPTLGLIGEGGESEYVVPASKAKGFSMRYLSGARGSAAIPTAGDGGPSSGPVNINIRTGPVMRQNGQNYVSVGDLEQALQTFADTMLRNNRTPGGRRYAGIG